MLDISAYERELNPLLGQGAGYALSLLRNKDDAEDAVQQAALRGWERIAQYDETRPFKGWWFAILKNCCLDVLRKKDALEVRSLEGIDPPAPRGSDPLEWQDLASGLERLSQAHREILRLKYFGGLSYDEIAAALDVPKGTVMSRLHLARKALARELSGEQTP